MIRRQASTSSCDCGQQVTVRQLTAYEFTWACACGDNRLISWAHKDDPPAFTPAQQTLFEAAEGKDAA